MNINKSQSQIHTNYYVLYIQKKSGMIWKQQKRKEAKHITVRAKRMVWHTSLQHFWKHLSSPFTSRDTISRNSDCWARPQLYWEPTLISWNNQSKQNTKRNLCKAEVHTVIQIVQVADELKHSGNTYSPLEHVAIKLQLSFQLKIYWGSCKALFNLNGSQELLIRRQKTPHITVL